MSVVENNLRKIKAINPRLSDKECLIIHNFMDHISDSMAKMNMENFSLIMLKGIMEEYHPSYSYGFSTMMDFKNLRKEIDAVLISLKGIEFNVFLDENLKVIVFREENPLRHIFEISVDL